MKPEKLLFILSLVILFLFGINQHTFSEGYYFTPSSVGSSAHMIRQGNIEGLSPIASSLFENPASLYLAKDLSLSLFTTKFMDEVTYQNIAISTKLSFGTVGLGFMNVGVDGIPHTFEKTFSENDSEFGVKEYFNYSNTILVKVWSVIKKL